ncbi:hypothetical protein [Micromonospora carbonacea]|uniref:hypothetical protein n=1 Tax=Micromonospora carbonacea TaxID=47853 RepID=UPI0037133260
MRHTPPLTSQQHVAAVVATAPPLTDEQRHRLAALLHPVTLQPAAVGGRRPSLTSQAAA